MRNYPIYKIPTDHEALSIGKNRTTDKYVMLVKASNKNNDPKISYGKQEGRIDISTLFAIEFESSRQVDAYINIFNDLYRRLKKEGK